EKRIIDRATYAEPFQYPDGLEYVIVNGQVVMDKGAHTGARPGRPLRHESLMAAGQGRGGSEASLGQGEKPRRLNATHAGEGPAWHAPSRSLYFTGDNRITRWETNDATHVFREPAGGANGLLFDAQGRLVACEAQNRRVTRTEASGALTVLADSFGGQK